MSSICGARSVTVTRPAGPTIRATSSAGSPVPLARSSTRWPGASWATASWARVSSRQKWTDLSCHLRHAAHVASSSHSVFTFASNFFSWSFMGRRTHGAGARRQGRVRVEGKTCRSRNPSGDRAEFCAVASGPVVLCFLATPYPMKKSTLSVLLVVWLGLPALVLAQSGKVFDSLTLPSKILNMERKYAVYLPPDYETSQRSYPVLYLLHGGGDDQTGWVQFGEVQHIADKSIADGTATAMIIVMPDANTGQRGFFNDIKGEWRYEDFFFEEFMPFIENK